MEKQLGSPVTRRRFVGQSLAAAATTALAGGLVGRASAAAPATPSGLAGPVGLPTPEQVRSDVQRMVDFGPRLVGHDAHNQFCDWVEGEFEAAGLRTLPCDNYAYDSWQTRRFGLELLDGNPTGPVEIATSYVRSAGTGPDGVTAPLFYAGTMPTESALAGLGGGANDHEAQLREWLAEVGDAARGKIVVVDLKIPGALSLGLFVAISSYLHWPGHSTGDWAAGDYRRPWIGPWPTLDVFDQLGAKGVVFIADAPEDELRDNYSPHQAKYQDLPALVVGRDAGAPLRERAKQGPTARLTLDAIREPSVVRAVTGILPGESDETLILCSHSDGQNAFEENGSVALVHLARHFASLPADQRLKRTLVFVTYPGHTSGYLPEVPGWLERHQDLAGAAAAAITIEHLGATEWRDDGPSGYRATGENEAYGIWTTQGPMQALAKQALIAADLTRSALLKPPMQITPGAAFHNKGIPHVAGIAGPTYLLVVSENGEMDKFDAQLAARQIGFYADVARRIDGVPTATLRSGDATLGSGYPAKVDRSAELACAIEQPPSPGNPGSPGTPALPGAETAPAGPSQVITVPLAATKTAPARTLTARFFGRRAKHRGVVVTLGTSDGSLAGVTVELRRNGELISRSAAVAATRRRRTVVLRRPSSRPFPVGKYTLVIRRDGKLLQRRSVRLGK